MSLTRRVRGNVMVRGVRGARNGYRKAAAALAVAGMLSPVGALAQGPAAGSASVVSNPQPAGVAAPAAPTGPTMPSEYVVGIEDIFTVKVWEDERIQGKVIVGPDGTVSLPLINSVRAAGLSFEQFRQVIADAAAKYMAPGAAVTVTLNIEQINSRKVYVSGEVRKIGVYPLVVPTTLSQMIVVAGGVTEYANKKKVVVNRVENGKPKSYIINYDDILKGKAGALDKDIELKPGDRINVPD